MRCSLLSDILQLYLKEKSLVSHNIESYNKFIQKGLQRVIDEVKEVQPDILPDNVRSLKIKFSKIRVDRPILREADGTRRPISPMESRLRGVTYEAPIILEMKMEKDDIETEKKEIRIGNIPVMLKAKNCYLAGKASEELVREGEDPNDPGGYFIINGTERVIVIIEDLAPNKIFVEPVTTGPTKFTGKIFSEDGRYRIPHTLDKDKEGMVNVTFTRIQKIPFAILAKALGITKDKEVMDLVSIDPQFQSDIYFNLFKTAEVTNEKEALRYIGKKMGINQEEMQVERAEEMLDKFLFPHIGHGSESRKMKAYFLGKAVKKLLLVSYGVLPKDDKDHYSNKRLRLSGDMLESLFRFSFRMLVGDMKYNFERLVKRGRIPNLASVVRSHLLTSRVRSALATGEWLGDRHGVSQHMDRLNHFAVISHLRRVVSLLTASRENFEARDLHPTHWGRLCSSETPEGPSVGLRKNLAITSEISTECDTQDEEVVKKLESFGFKGI